MRTDELRDVLSQHGDAVQDIGVPARTDAVRQRVRIVRRRRAALVSGGVATAVAAVALAVVPGIGGTSSPGPAEDVPGRPASGTPESDFVEETWSTVHGYTKDGLNFPTEVDGEALMAAEIGDPGEVELEVDVVVPDGGLRWIPICYGVDGDHLVHVAIDGHLLSGVSCQTAQPVDPATGGITFDGDPTAPLRAWGLEPGDLTTARVWLSRADGPERSVARDPEAVVGLALYEDPGPQEVADLLPHSLQHAGRSWSLERVVESSDGDLRLDDRVARRGEPVLLVAGVDRLRGGSTYTVSVDGEEVLRRGNTGVAGPSWETVMVLDAGAGADLRVELVDGAADAVRFVLAQYRPAG